MKLLVLTAALVALCGCGRFFYFPDKNLYVLPSQVGLKATDVYFDSSDGTRLHGWFFPAAAKKGTARGTVVQFHGNAENISSHFASLAWITKHDYNLFTFDYRGYGKSAGKPTAFGLYQDGMAALDKAWELHKNSRAKKFVVYGQSLGGIVAMRAFADFRHQAETDLVVMDSTFVSYKDLVQEKLASHWLTWLFSPLGRLSVSDRFASKEVLPKIKAPLLVVHDERDPVVDFDNGNTLYKLAGSSKKELWKLNRGRHIETFSADILENRQFFLESLE